MATEKQHLRNALADIEDEARTLRNEQGDLTETDHQLRSAFRLIARLTQIIREDLVK